MTQPTPPADARPIAAVYARVSTRMQVAYDRHSLPTQVQEDIRLAERHGYRVPDEYIFQEQGSGKSMEKRYILAQLRTLVQQRAIKAVVLYSVDRFGRNQMDGWRFILETVDSGVRVLVLDPPIDSATEDGIDDINEELKQAERELRRYRRRSRQAALGRAYANLPNVGRAPLYGYEFAGERKERFTVHPEQGQKVQRIFAEAANGHTLRSIRARLIAEGIPSPGARHGSRWANSTEWYRATIGNMLADRRYTGVATTLRMQVQDDYSVAARDEAQVITLPPGTYPPLVDAETFEAVQRILQKNRETAIKTPRNPEAAMLRGGFIKCPHCGFNMAVSTAKDGTRYKCQDNNRLRYGCPNTSIYASVLDPQVWERVSYALLHPNEIVAAVQRQHDEWEAAVAVDLAPIDRLIQANDREQAQYLDAIGMATGPAVMASLVAKLELLAADRQRLDAERERVTARLRKKEDQERTLAELAAWERDLVEDVDVEDELHRRQVGLANATWDEKRRILAALDVQVRLYPQDAPERFTMTAAIPLDRSHYDREKPWGPLAVDGPIPIDFTRAVPPPDAVMHAHS